MTQSEWQEFVEQAADAQTKRIFEIHPSGMSVSSFNNTLAFNVSFEEGAQFVEDNLDKHPRVTALILALEKIRDAKDGDGPKDPNDIMMNWRDFCKTISKDALQEFKDTK